MYNILTERESRKKDIAPVILKKINWSYTEKVKESLKEMLHGLQTNGLTFKPRKSIWQRWAERYLPYQGLDSRPQASVWIWRSTRWSIAVLLGKCVNDRLTLTIVTIMLTYYLAYIYLVLKKGRYIIFSWLTNINLQGYNEISFALIRIWLNLLLKEMYWGNENIQGVRMLAVYLDCMQ